MAPSSTSKASSSSEIIPSSEARYVKKGTDLHSVIRKYNFGNDAVLDTSHGAKILHRKVKITISKYAVDESGKVSRRWLQLSTQTRGLMIKDLISKARWLGRFEDDWAAEWILRKAVNQRVVDWQRKTGINTRIRRTLSEMSFSSPSSKFTPGGRCLSQ